WGGGGCSRSC
ncbi:polymorphic outer membrane protein, partial [Chlamydia psittaci C19/98]